MKKVYLFILLSFFILLSACGSQTAGTSSNQNTQNTGNSANPPAPGGYLATGSNYVIFIQFTETNNILSGEWYEALVYTITDGYGNKTDSVHTFQSTFTATLSGTQFNAILSAPAGLQSTFTGSYDGNNVTLEFTQPDGTLSPITLNQASVDDYNTAVTTLQTYINTQNQQVADNQATAVAAQATAAYIADQQNRLAIDLQNMGSEISSLNTDADFSSLLAQYQTVINQEQKDYQTEQTDVSTNCSSVSYDAGTVDYDAGTIQYYDGGLSYQDNSVSNDIATVQDDINKIAQHWNNLGKSSPGVSQADIDSALQNGSSAIKQAQANQQDAHNKANSFDSTAKQLKQQADTLSNNTHC